MSARIRFALPGVLVALLASAVARAAPVAVTVSPALDRRDISPLVYGVNFGTDAAYAGVPYTVQRWGGNSTTRYNWQLDTHNTASDWFFMNIPSDLANPAALPDGSKADQFVAASRARGAEVVMTAPTIGWTPKARRKDWGYSVSRYGAQTATECTATGGVFWCTADAGNGLSAPGGAPITGNDPHDTSIEVGPDFLGGWLNHLHSRFGTAATGGVRYWALDNEPALWNSTHRDVHPAPLTYDELWQRTSDYASRIKLLDPTAKVMGPVSWGWCEYFYSAADGCGPGADMAAHGNLPLTTWYLRQVNQNRLAGGVPMVDLLDLHYYPQDGSALNDDESPTTAARRLRELKSLYDSTYVDESWIGQPVRLIPRFRQLIAQNCPDLGLAITEYNFGGDTGISSALAQAEALAIFGREGVTLATRWVVPGAGTRCEDAFRMYLSYDGAGARVTGQSVRATSAAVDRVGAYAIDDAPTGRLFVLLFNKSTVAETAQLTVTDGLGSAIALWRFTAASPLASAGTAALTSGAVDLLLPARSATLALIARPTAGVPGAPPGAFALRTQPNPARGPATVVFTLPREAETRLSVYSVDGRHVRSLLAGEVAAGEHALAWDGRDDAGRDLPPGLYLCRLSSGGASEQRTIVRVK